MNALLFPGQGVQKVGMLDFLIASNPEVKNLIISTSEVLDFDLLDLISNGPEEKINLTEYAQPAILASSVAIARSSDITEKISFTAGLSLGEYSALVYAECIDFKDAIRLVNNRGRLMQNAVPEGTAGMLVILNMPLSEIATMIEKINEFGKIIDFSTDNADGVSVLAGTNSAIENCINYIENGDFRRVKTQLIKMSVPSHCFLLESAQEELAKLLNQIDFSTPKIPVLPNVLALPTTDTSAIKEALISQLCSTVRWRESIEYLIKNDLKKIYDAGPEKTIISMARKLKDIEKRSLLDI
ncbi:ACP S-malonyltransferase [SAR86 cluster bacterium]|nr:ACP S-malonyltransferase [SAR86 cluster bacterium]